MHVRIRSCPPITPRLVQIRQERFQNNQPPLRADYPQDFDVWTSWSAPCGGSVLPEWVETIHPLRAVTTESCIRLFVRLLISSGLMTVNRPNTCRPLTVRWFLIRRRADDGR